jgi:hypothetical protein
VIFKFPKKKIVLDCFTNKEFVLRSAPIAHAIKHIPDWWRALPNSYVEKNSFFPSVTMKHCAAMVNYYANSVAIPLWCDLAIEVRSDKSCRWQFSDEYTQSIVHPLQQRGNFLDNHQHLKIESPWCLETKQDIKWVWSQPTYSFNKDAEGIKVLPGVLDFYNQYGTNINLMFSLDREAKFFLPQGQAMVHLTPMFDGEVKIVRHLISNEEYARKIELHTSITFVNKFKKAVDRRQQFSDCPYHKE